MTTAYQDLNELGPAQPLSRGKQLLRGLIHFFSYHFILKRRTSTVTRAAGFRLTLRPTVFHPRWASSTDNTCPTGP